MKKYEIELASFRKITVEAESKEEADDMVAVMEDEDIEEQSRSDGYIVWNEAREIH